MEFTFPNSGAPPAPAWYHRTAWIAAIVFFIAVVPRAIFPSATTICFEELGAKDSGPMLELLKKGDFMSEKWADYPVLPFCKYIFGLIPQILFGSNPSDPMDLVGSRMMAALIGAGMVMATFLVGTQLMSRNAALFSAILLAFIPTVLGHDRIATQDGPSRLVAMMGWFYMLRWHQNSARRDLILSSVLLGLSITFSERIGLESGVTLAIWLAIVLWRSPRTRFTRFAIYFGYAGVSLATFLLAALILWPYLWFRPWELMRWYADPATMMPRGGSLEFWMGKIQHVPFSYYFIILAVSTPPLTLLAFLGWNLENFRKMTREPGVLAIPLLVLVPLMIESFTLRQSLSHNLQLLFPALSLGAGAMIWTIHERVKARSKNAFVSLLVLVIPFLMEISACICVAPYFMQYFNIGGLAVAEKKLFSQATFGEAMNPLFDYLHKEGREGSTVYCRLGAWPGLLQLARFLGPKFTLQGQQTIDPLGARYILRYGGERDNAFYRYEPDPRYYRKKIDVLIDKGSFADFWERRADVLVTGIVYYDDFASLQSMKLAVGGQNFNINPFSDGKLYAVKPNTPAAIIIRLPSSILRGMKTFFIQSDVQVREGQVMLSAGVDPNALKPLGHAEKYKGSLQTPDFSIPKNKDLFFCIAWSSAYNWNNQPDTFWEADWIDALRVFGKPD